MDRSKLDDDQFAIPEDRRYPIPDEEHGRLALGRCKGKPEESRVRSAVLAKFPALKDLAEQILGKGWRDNWRHEHRGAHGEWDGPLGGGSLPGHPHAHVDTSNGPAEHDYTDMSRDDLRFKLSGLQITISKLHEELDILHHQRGSKNKRTEIEDRITELESRREAMRTALDGKSSEDYEGKANYGGTSTSSGGHNPTTRRGKPAPKPKPKPSSGGADWWATEARDTLGKWTTGSSGSSGDKKPSTKKPGSGKKPGSAATADRKRALTGPPQTRQEVRKNGLRWGGQVFHNRKRFTEWLKEHGVTWEHFAEKHPDAAEGLAERGHNKSGEWHIMTSDALIEHAKNLEAEFMISLAEDVVEHEMEAARKKREEVKASIAKSEDRISASAAPDEKVDLVQHFKALEDSENRILLAGDALRSGRTAEILAELDSLEHFVKTKIPDRGKLDDSTFALPGERRYPIPDEEHGKLALGRCKGKPEEDKVRAAVLKKYPGLKDYAKQVLDA